MTASAPTARAPKSKDGLFETAGRWLKGFARIRRLRAENRAAARKIEDDLIGFSAKEVERRLADLGLEAADLAALAEGRSIPQRLVPAMMKRLGIDPSVVERNPRLIERIADACRHCDAVPECEEWLDSEEPGRSYPRFCPNLDAFMDLPRRHDGLVC